MIYRIHKTENYTVMSNYHLRDHNLSLKAKGLLSLMLSLPKEWDYSIEGLYTLLKDGKDSIMTTLNELEKFGYLVRTQKNDEKGRFSGYDYDVYEEPYAEKPCTEKPYTEKPNTVNPNTEKPYTENPTQLNTNIINIKESNTKESNTDYKTIVEYLNSKVGKKYLPSNKDTQKHINARLNDGFTVEDFFTVIDKKVKEWKGTEFEQYLCPSTLFSVKFERYLNAPDPKSQTSQTQEFASGSFDTDDFVVAALARTERMFAERNKK